MTLTKALVWPLALSRLALFASPMLVAWRTLDAGGPREAVLAAWAIYMVSALDIDVLTDSSVAHTPQHLASEYMLTFCIVTRTLWGLQVGGRDAAQEMLWMIPIMIAIGHMAMIQVIKSANSEDSIDVEPSRPNAQLLISLMVWRMGMGLWVLIEDGSNTGTSEQFILHTLELVLSIGVIFVQIRSDQHDSLLQLAYLDFVALPLIGASSARTIQLLMAIGSVIIVLLSISAGAIKPGMSRSQRIIAIARDVSDVFVRILTSPRIFQAAYLIAGVIVLTSCNEAWYQSHTDFPAIIRVPARIARLFIDEVVRRVYEFTSQKDFQILTVLAAPQFSAFRGLIFRALNLGYRIIVLAADGASLIYTPWDGSVLSLACIGLMAFGWLATSLQVLPDGAAYMRSKWFWGFNTIVSMGSLFIMHFAADTAIMAWSCVFKESSHERTYTDVGRTALYGHIALTASCIVMFVLRVMESRKPAFVGARLTFVETIRLNVMKVVDYLTKPSVLVAIGGVFIFAIGVGSYGSPVASYELVSISTGAPDWLVSTDFDKVAIFGSGLIDLLPSEVKLVQIALMMGPYLLRQLGCWGCVCLDSIMDVVDSIGGAIGGIFGRRRRLLEHRAGSTNFGLRALRLPKGHRRKLHAFFDDLDDLDSCDSDDSCDTRICLSDTVKDFLKKVIDAGLKGIEWCIKTIWNKVLSLIPGVGDLIRLFDKLIDLDDLMDFSLFDIDNIDLGLRFNIFDGLLNIPDLPSWNDIAVAMAFVVASLAFGVFGAYHMGILSPLVDAGIASLEVTVVAGAITLIATLLCMVYGIRELLRSEAKDLDITWNNGIYVYATAGVVWLVALLLRIGQDDLALVQQVRRATKKKKKGERVELLSHVK